MSIAANIISLSKMMDCRHVDDDRRREQQQQHIHPKINHLHINNHTRTDLIDSTMAIHSTVSIKDIGSTIIAPDLCHHTATTVPSSILCKMEEQQHRHCHGDDRWDQELSSFYSDDDDPSSTSCSVVEVWDAQTLQQQAPIRSGRVTPSTTPLSPSSPTCIHSPASSTLCCLPAISSTPISQQGNGSVHCPSMHNYSSRGSLHHRYPITSLPSCPSQRHLDPPPSSVAEQRGSYAKHPVDRYLIRHRDDDGTHSHNTRDVASHDTFSRSTISCECLDRDAMMDVESSIQKVHLQDTTDKSTSLSPCQASAGIHHRTNPKSIHDGEQQRHGTHASARVTMAHKTRDGEAAENDNPAILKNGTIDTVKVSSSCCPSSTGAAMIGIINPDDGNTNDSVVHASRTHTSLTRQHATLHRVDHKDLHSMNPIIYASRTISLAPSSCDATAATTVKTANHAITCSTIHSINNKMTNVIDDASDNDDAVSTTACTDAEIAFVLRSTILISFMSVLQQRTTKTTPGVASKKNNNTHWQDEEPGISYHTQCSAIHSQHHTRQHLPATTSDTLKPCVSQSRTRTAVTCTHVVPFHRRTTSSIGNDESQKQNLFHHPYMCLPLQTPPSSSLFHMHPPPLPSSVPCTQDSSAVVESNNVQSCKNIITDDSSSNVTQNVQQTESSCHDYWIGGTADSTNAVHTAAFTTTRRGTKAPGIHPDGHHYNGTKNICHSKDITIHPLLCDASQWMTIRRRVFHEFPLLPHLRYQTKHNLPLLTPGTRMGPHLEIERLLSLETDGIAVLYLCRVHTMHHGVHRVVCKLTPMCTHHDALHHDTLKRDRMNHPWYNNDPQHCCPPSHDSHHPLRDGNSNDVCFSSFAPSGYTSRRTTLSSSSPRNISCFLPWNEALAWSQMHPHQFYGNINFFVPFIMDTQKVWLWNALFIPYYPYELRGFMKRLLEHHTMDISTPSLLSSALSLVLHRKSRRPSPPRSSNSSSSSSVNTMIMDSAPRSLYCLTCSLNGRIPEDYSCHASAVPMECCLLPSKDNPTTNNNHGTIGPCCNTTNSKQTTIMSSTALHGTQQPSVVSHDPQHVRYSEFTLERELVAILAQLFFVVLVPLKQRHALCHNDCKLNNVMYRPCHLRRRHINNHGGSKCNNNTGDYNSATTCNHDGDAYYEEEDACAYVRLVSNGETQGWLRIPYYGRELFLIDYGWSSFALSCSPGIVVPHAPPSCDTPITDASPAIAVDATAASGVDSDHNQRRRNDNPCQKSSIKYNGDANNIHHHQENFSSSLVPQESDPVLVITSNAPNLHYKNHVFHCHNGYTDVAQMATDMYYILDSVAGKRGMRILRQMPLLDHLLRIMSQTDRGMLLDRKRVDREHLFYRDISTKCTWYRREHDMIQSFQSLFTCTEPSNKEKQHHRCIDYVLTSAACSSAVDATSGDIMRGGNANSRGTTESSAKMTTTTARLSRRDRVKSSPAQGRLQQQQSRTFANLSLRKRKRAS